MIPKYPLTWQRNEPSENVDIVDAEYQFIIRDVPQNMADAFIDSWNAMASSLVKADRLYEISERFSFGFSKQYPVASQRLSNACEEYKRTRGNL